MFCLVTEKGSTLEEILFYKGQINLSRGLKWGIVHLYSSKTARDIAKNDKKQVLAKTLFCKKWRFFFTKTQKSLNW